MASTFQGQPRMSVANPGPWQELRTRERSDRGPRVLTDEEGHIWRVREVWFSDAPPSLIFESDTGFRRIRHYPESWRSMGDTELYELSWRT
jgi:hypothetical protein